MNAVSTMTPEAMARIIGRIAEKYSISLSELRAAFPVRPTTEAEYMAIAQWMQAKHEAELAEQTIRQPAYRIARPTPPPAAPQGIATRRDKSGKPMPSYYAVEMEGTLKFFRIKAGRKAGFYFIDEQASDEFHAIRNYTYKMGILQAIRQAGPEQAMQRYGQELGSCGHCHRTLTDETSRALGIGPVCRADM